MGERLKGKVAVITGAAGGGVGEAAASALSAEGALIVVNDISRDSQGGYEADKVVRKIIETGGTAVANYESVTDAFKTFLKKCGIKFKPIHILRNTNASIRLKANQPITYVAHQLGHANPEITLRICSHLIPQDGEFTKQQVLALENTIANFRNQNPIRKPLEMSK